MWPFTGSSCGPLDRLGKPTLPLFLFLKNRVTTSISQGSFRFLLNHVFIHLEGKATERMREMNISSIGSLPKRLPTTRSDLGQRQKPRTPSGSPT